MRMVCQSIMLSLLLAVTNAHLQLLGGQLIAATGVKDVALIPLASDYMGIRSLAQPAVLVTMVAQSGGAVVRITAITHNVQLKCVMKLMMVWYNCECMHSVR